MEYTRLGSSGLKVSRIGLGTMGYGDGSDPFWSWAVPYEQAAPFFKQALEMGINFWDTANVYGRGSSELIVGQAIKAFTRRDDIVLATKLNNHMHDGPGGQGLSRKAIMEQIDASLTRLNTDYVDLYQIHRFDKNTPVEETMDALNDVVKSGKARYIGASSMFAWQFAKMQHAAETHGWTKFISMQNQYNLVQRGDELEMFGLLQDQGVGSIPWSPLAAGVMARPWNSTGSVRGKTNPRTDEVGRPLWYDSDQGTVDAVEKISSERGVPMAAIALAWVLHNPVVDAPIVGASKENHLVDAVTALTIELTDAEVRALEEHYTLRVHTYFDYPEK
ncbi:aldo/keto reductase [Rhodococcus sp. WS1]|uniref:aldo/keto reductase n=1 Tax=unclassified Rhodococcus (in: high G+C Gram-positive bacteria) TaxID=192944 RepID=UPI0011434152|nr:MULTISPECIES: aldo/keto reductase [unclassified Rhodococcus (in: high G+C Gram-positive bacteria)]ROZ52900.1 aldo/keto reductase [Rhodococcus sp. WS1]TQC35991.1 aldo/keto reductase [Rhodococcus sp. WS7]